jgi:hypothetical protein
MHTRERGKLKVVVTEITGTRQGSKVRNIRADDCLETGIHIWECMWNYKYWNHSYGTLAKEMMHGCDRT